MASDEGNYFLHPEPVILIHLEDPPGSHLAACTGERFINPNDESWQSTPRFLCPGCNRSVRVPGENRVGELRGGPGVSSHPSDRPGLTPAVATLVARAWTWRELQRERPESPMHPYHIVEELVELVTHQAHQLVAIRKAFDEYDAAGVPRNEMLAYNVLAEVRELFYPYDETESLSKNGD